MKNSLTWKSSIDGRPYGIRGWLLNYGFALLMIGAAIAVRFLLQAIFGYNLPYLTFLPAVMVVGLLAGFGPGLFATILSAAVVTYFFLEPTGSLAIRNVSDIVGMLLFIFLAIATNFLVEVNRRHTAELNLKSSELARAQAIGHIGSWDFDFSRNLVTLSDETCRILDVPLATRMPIERFWERVHRDDLQQVRDAWSAALEGRAMEIEFRIEVGGRIRWVRLISQIEFSDRSKPTFATGTLQDIDERKRTRDAIRQERDQAQRYLDVAGVILLALDRDANITMINRMGCSILGWEEKELLGRNWLEIGLPARFRPVFLPVFQDMLAGKLSSLENPVLTRSGEERIIEWQNSIVRDRDGRVIGTLSSGEDITERKRMEQDLEISRAQTVTTARLSALGMMAGGIAHEINNPLAIIHASASDLLEMAESGEVPLKDLEGASNRIKNTANRIANIVSSLRQISRDGSADPFQWTPVSAIVEQALEVCRQKFRIHSVRLEVSPSATDLRVFCREVQISQVLLNLLQNAFDAVIESDGDRWVRLEVKGNEESVDFAVMDSGPGIRPELRSRIMEPFFTTKPVGKGTGIGLSLSKSIIEDHGGKLWLDERQMHTCFSFTLPVPKRPRNGTQECHDSVSRR